MTAAGGSTVRLERLGRLLARFVGFETLDVWWHGNCDMTHVAD
jgi:hypothetical protein